MLRWMFPQSKHRGSTEVRKLFRCYLLRSKVTGLPVDRRHGDLIGKLPLAASDERVDNVSKPFGNRTEKDCPLFWSVRLFNYRMLLIESN